MLRVFASAKINLWLHVLGRRPDGFHDIATLMLPLELADEICVERADTLELICEEPSLPKGEENLVIRAIRILEKHTGRSLPVRLTLTKRIPAGAGLAGGSSDAVAVLKAVNTLHELGLNETQLLAAAAEIGSDTAFFVRGEAAICRGRGEILEPAGDVSALAEAWVVLIKPPFGVSTPWAYARWASLQPPPGETQDYQTFSLRNDLENPVFEKYIALAAMKAWLLDQPAVEAALMSGSGSTIFALLPNESAAWELAMQAQAHFGSTFWTKVTRLKRPEV